MNTKTRVVALMVCLLLRSRGSRASEPELKTAAAHPIQYYLSLPDGWTATKKWPVVIVIDGADRQFLEATNAFSKARQRQPFIIVTPLVVTGGGAGYRGVPTYHYTDAVWNQIQNVGQFTFDSDGISAIMKDVARDYGGELKCFITGFEAGGHTVFGVLFNSPELLRGAVLVCPNYLGRWVDEHQLSSSPERVNLPIKMLIGSKDELCAPGHPIYAQLQRAMSLAEEHGYKNVSVSTVEGKGHERLADEVLRHFASLLNR